MVTHDMAEALLLADRIVVLIEGRILADAAPAELLAERSDPEVRALIDVPRAPGGTAGGAVSPALAVRSPSCPPLVRAPSAAERRGGGARRRCSACRSPSGRRAAALVRAPVLGLAGLVQTIPAWLCSRFSIRCC